jgi:predicted RNase H-like HicB family nuclease
MAHYIALVHKEKNSAYGVQFPDVPGCFSAADRMEDVSANAMEALSLWAEDQSPVRPRTIDEIKKDKSVLRELAGGAFLLAVPFVENDTRVVSANISLERGVLKAIDAEAKRRKLTRSAFLAQAARREMGR